MDVLKKWLFFLIGLSFNFSVYASWKVDESVDAMTDNVKKVAYVTNESGYKFSIYRLDNGAAVWGNFSVANNFVDLIDWEKPPIFRVDKNKPVNLARKKRIQELGFEAYEWQPKWVNFVLWHGKESDGLSSDLITIMNGHNIVFRFYLSTGGYKETTFSLDGANSAISKAIDFEMNNSDIESTLNKQKEMKPVFTNAIGKCRSLSNSEFKACMKLLSQCRKNNLLDKDGFNKCFSY